MPDFLVDGPNRLLIEPTQTGNPTYDIQRDIYSAWKRWVATDDNAKFLPAFEPEGGTPIGATGFATGSTLVLINGWRLQPADYNHVAFLAGGNLFSDDGVVVEAAPTASASFQIISAVAAQGIETGSGVPAATQTQIDELHQIRGLNALYRVRVTGSVEEIVRISDGVVVARLDIGGDGTTESTLERSL